MTLPYLTDDCIFYILQHLQKNHSTLFNCLLVNRFWCKSTIPLLYANPFNPTIKITEKNSSIILTLIFCFNKEEILQLKNQLELNQINNINLDEEYKPLFEYPKYLEKYNYFAINSVIKRCFIRYCSDLSTSLYKINNIIPIFHQSILRQSRNIKKINISLYMFNREMFKNFNIQNFTSKLTKLNFLSLSSDLNDTDNNEIGQEFLSNIANICLNLKYLIIKLPKSPRSLLSQHVTSNYLINSTTSEKYCTIIQKQKELKIFKIMNCYSLLKNILLSLEFQKNSLFHIEFTNINFSNVSLKSFNNLYNLKYLKFDNCEDILLGQCEILNFASFKLKELIFLRNNWNFDVILLMIKYLGASLQRLSIENPTILLLENITTYCPNLIFLEIGIHLPVDISFLSFFRNLRIKILSISIFSFNTKLYIDLANNIPINISKISIYHYNFNKFLRFKEFLENCHNGFKIINLNHIIELEFLKIVLNYIERSNNSLKILGMLGLDKKLKSEELNLLNSIKAKEVKIMEFNSMHGVYKGIKY